MIHDLDAIFRSSKPGDIIRLPAGVYTTLGVPTVPIVGAPAPEHLKVGCALLGDPAGGTTILNIRPWEGDITSVLGDGDNIVSDITIDCGIATDPNTRWKRNGYYGNQKATTILTRVKCIHPRGNFLEMRESFGLAVASQPEHRSIIQDCEVSDVRGDYSTAIQGGFLLNNHVSWAEPPGYLSRQFRVAYNLGGSAGARVINCTSRFADVGIYSDWLDCIGLKVEGCTFYSCKAGMNLNLQTSPTQGPVRCVKDLVFTKNTILCDVGSKQVHAILLDHSTSDSIYRENTCNFINQVEICENTIGFTPGPDLCIHRYVINCASYTPAAKRTATLGISEVSFYDNTVDPTMTYRNRSKNADLNVTSTTPITWIA